MTDYNLQGTVKDLEGNTATASTKVSVNNPLTLLFSEDFTGATQAYYEARGWYDGTANITTNPTANGYKFETDAVLGRNVMYAHWASISNGGSPGTAWRLPLDPTKTGPGVTVYVVAKFHNFASSGGGLGGHWIRHARGFGTWTPTNTAGQMDLDMCPHSADGSTQIWDTATGLNITSAQQPTILYTPYYSVESTLHYCHPPTTAVVDDKWYELVWYLLPSSGDLTPDGAINVKFRPLGSTTWIQAMKSNAIRSAQLGPIPSIVNIQYTMLTPYFNNAWINDMRFYFATYRVYVGDVTGVL